MAQVFDRHHLVTSSSLATILPLRGLPYLKYKNDQALSLGGQLNN